MTINLIACVAEYKEKLAIGTAGTLVLNLNKDIEYFSKITKYSVDRNSHLSKNVVLMGRKTYLSIPFKNRPLKDRFNIVLTNNPELASDRFEKDDYSKPYFMNLKSFMHIYSIYTPNVFVAGGSEIYNMFLSNVVPELFIPKNLYITQVLEYSPSVKPDRFMDFPDSSFELIGYSEKYRQKSVSFRYLRYERKNENTKNSSEIKYFDMVNKILSEGTRRIDRTNTGTTSIFGTQIHFDIRNTVPMLTTKKIPFKSIVEELLWFCRGDTDSKILESRGVKIWKQNTSKNFLESRGLLYREGVLGPGYGWQLRHQGEKYLQEYADTTGLCIGGFDQLKYVVDLLEKDPFSRRIMISFWNPSDFNKTALLPCHVTVQFYVTEKDNVKYLSCHFTMRSNDIFLGNPFNLMSYTLLTYILALKTGMVPDKLVYSCGDAHIYNNHLNQIKEQMNRTHRPAPSLYLNPNVKHKDWNELLYSDFELVGYFPHPSIKGVMAV